MKYNNFLIKRGGVFLYREIQLIGSNGGLLPVPENLSGLFTSENEAKKAIDAYLLNRIPEAE